MLEMGASPERVSGGGRDLRRTPRYNVDVRIKLIVTKEGKNFMVHGRGNDIGESGMAMFVAHDLAVGQRVEVEFTLPYSRQPMRVGITIRNKNGYRYGAEFMTLSTPQKEEISRLCKALTLLQ